MRDIRKDSSYFKRYLDNQKLRIEKKKEKFNGSISDESQKQRILVSLTTYEINLLKAEFSYGATEDELKIYLKNAIDVIKYYKKPAYEDILILLSMAIMLNCIKEAKEYVKVHKELISQDRLLNFLAEYIQDEKIEWNDNISLYKDYAGLNEVFISNNKTASLLNYLEKWYESREEYAWYNSHLRDTETYCGYWCFESAAISKVLHISDDDLKQNVYFPSL